LFEQKPGLRSRIRVRFAGAHPQWLHDQVSEFNLGDVIEFLGYLSHRDCLDFQASCDCLLITSAKVLGGEAYPVSSKTFEYVITGKPILAVVAPGAQRDFMLGCGTSLVCDPDDPVETARKIETLFASGVDLKPNFAFLKSYEGREISASMAGLIESIAAGRIG
jgi:glycosyltransferase involved in cell wall biosynthesis